MIVFVLGVDDYEDAVFRGWGCGGDGENAAEGLGMGWGSGFGGHDG